MLLNGFKRSAADLVEQARHGDERLAVGALLRLLELREIVDVLFGVDAEEVAPHGKGLAERIRYHAVSRDVMHLRPAPS